MSNRSLPSGEFSAAQLKERFDGVLYLAPQTWHLDPTAEDTLYLKLCAAAVPVLVVRADLNRRTHLFDRTDITNLIILHVGEVFDAEGSLFLHKTIKQLGFKRQLLWIADQRYSEYLNRVQHLFKVYDARALPLCPSSGCSSAHGEARTDQLRSQLEVVDLLVSPSARIAAKCHSVGTRARHTTIIFPGCDYNAWQRPTQPKSDRPVAVYLGAIDKRIDYLLLHKLIHEFNEWDFWFCGMADGSLEWEILLDHPNVFHQPSADPREAAKVLQAATVGLFPFVRTEVIRTQWPSQILDYFACGLQVVSVQIDDAGNFAPGLRLASGAEEFAKAMYEIRRNEHHSKSLGESLKTIAQQHSIERNFVKFFDEIFRTMRESMHPSRRLNILVLYDDRENHIMTVHEHLTAFQKYSKNNVIYLPGTFANSDAANDFSRCWDLNVFDVVIVHYAVRLSLKKYIHPGIARELQKYDGLKILFIQDEYENTETARTWMERLEFDAVYTCTPDETRELIYPRSRFRSTEFIRTLTGFVPDNEIIDQFSIPMSDRNTRLAYRGRQLPLHYGKLGFDKFRIGVEVKTIAETRRIAVDIEVTDDKRKYGLDWYRFIGSARATLGTESGCNIFDEYGSLKDLAEKLKDAPVEEAYAEHFAAHEGPIRMNQISPRVFEAIRLRTALVLFEGEYSGIVKPGVHFIPLKKDLSNIDEVLEKLEDIQYLVALTSRAYTDVIESGQYSYRQFISEVDRYIDSRVFGDPRAELILSPIVRRRRNQSFEVFPYQEPWEYAMTSTALGGDFQRTELAKLMEAASQNDACSIAENVDQPEQIFLPGYPDVSSNGGDFSVSNTDSSPGSINSDVPIHLSDGNAPLLPSKDDKLPTSKRSTSFPSTVFSIIRVFVPPSARLKIGSHMKIILMREETLAIGKRRLSPARVAWKLLPKWFRSELLRRLQH